MKAGNVHYGMYSEAERHLRCLLMAFPGRLPPPRPKQMINFPDGGSMIQERDISAILNGPSDPPVSTAKLLRECIEKIEKRKPRRRMGVYVVDASSKSVRGAKEPTDLEVAQVMRKVIKDVTAVGEDVTFKHMKMLLLRQYPHLDIDNR